ncbi:VWA domain-containing protein [Aestuariispira insulae]|nr:VWA domain-containing protein [Aestuariispira insulae]
MAKLPTDKEKQAPQSSQADVNAFLAKVEKAVPAQRSASDRPGRLIFAMDATASRQPMWDHACHLQADMFRETANIGGLSIQLVYYRGFNECKASRWQQDGKGLARIMSGVTCLGGHTQIGRVLRHGLNANDKGKVDALVFVGDAFEEDIDAVCHDAGQLGLVGIPVFLFQEGRDPVAERAFKQIAKLTGGAWCPFDADSAKQLRDLLSAVAVYASGGRQAMLDFARDRSDLKQLTQQIRER